jgi:hypothetical protein
MDVARLPSTGYSSSAYPLAARNNPGRERVLELVSDVQAATLVREPVERVVQGEVLQRQRSVYGSTKDFLDSRPFEGIHVTDRDMDRQARANPGQAQRALGAYLGHTREFIQPDLNRGKQVDYFV